MDELEKSRSIVGRNLKRVRKRFKLPLREFGREVGYSHTHISEVERGNATASYALLRSVSLKYNIPMAYWTVVNDLQEDTVNEIEGLILTSDNLDGAIQKVDQLIAEADNNLQRIHFFNLKGKVLLQMGSYRAALNVWVEARNLLSETGDIEHHFTVLYNVALCHYRLNEYDKARKTLSEAQENYDSPELRPQALQLKANIYANQNEIDRAKEIHNLLLETYKDRGELLSIIQSLHNLADIDRKIGDHQKAIERYREALSIATDNLFYEVMCICAKDLSDVYLQLGELSDARRLLAKAVQTAGNRVAVPLRASLYLKHARIAQDRERKRKDLFAAFDLLKNTDDNRLLQEVCMELGDMFYEENNSLKSLQYYKIASDAFKITRGSV